MFLTAAIMLFVLLLFIAQWRWLDFRFRISESVERARADGFQRGLAERGPSAPEASPKQTPAEPQRSEIQRLKASLAEEQKRVADLDEKRVQLVRELDKARTDVQALESKADELQSQIDRRRTTAELSDLGWTPLHLSCLPEPDQQILVGGLRDGTPLHKTDGVWHAKYLGHEDGKALLGDGGRGRLKVKADGRVFWIPVHIWRTMTDRAKSQRLSEQLSGSPPSRSTSDDVPTGSRPQPVPNMHRSSVDPDTADVQKQIERLERELDELRNRLRDDLA